MIRSALLSINVKNQAIFSQIVGIVLLLSSSACSAQANQVRTEPLASKLSQGQHFADLPGVRIAYKVEGHGPLLVEQSVGWGAGSRYLQLGLAPLEKHFTVIYVDARGNGLSTRPADPARMSDSVMVDDLEHLRAYLDLPAINLLGHSNGADIVLGYAERYPDRVKKLVLLDPQVTGTDPALWAGTERIIQLRSKDPRFAYAAKHFEDPDAETDEGFAKELAETAAMYLYNPANAEIFAKSITTPPPSAWANEAATKANKGHTLPEAADAGKVRARTLIVSGRWDVPCPVEVAEKIHTLIPGSQLAIFEKSGHIVWLDQPKPFYERVIHFLES